MDELDILRAYAESGSEDAFRGVVERHVDLVHASALRQVRDPHLAEEVTQAVFIVLARKAGQLPRGTVLAGWLFRVTRFTAARALRGEWRRQRHEQRAARELPPMHATEPETGWEMIAPVLDEAISSLGEKDRDAIILRFFEKKSLQDVGSKLGSSEEAAKKRVARALEKLRGFFSRRGIVVPSAILASTFASYSAPAAPAGLAASVTAAMAGTGSAVTVSTLTLVKETLNMIIWTQLKLVAACGIVLVLATAAVTVAAVKRPSTPPVANIVPDQTTPKGTLRYLANALRSGDGDRFVGALALTIEDIPEEAENWKPALATLVKAQADFRRALITRYGEREVRQSVTFWQQIDRVVDILLRAEEIVEGDQAKLAVTFGGRTFAVPLLTRQNEKWYLAVDFRARGLRTFAGDDRHSINLAISDTGARVKLEAADELTTELAREKIKVWSGELTARAKAVNDGQFATLREAADLELE